MSAKNFLTRTINFFRKDVDAEIVGAYFDGEKVFVARTDENLEIVSESSDIEHIAEKISRTCKKNSVVGFCLRDDDALTFQTEINFPEKEIPAFVKSWSLAQYGKDAAFSFAKIGGDIWMETLPKSTLDEFCAAFEKFGLNLRALSVMPADLLTKLEPLDRTKFISEVLLEKKSPNLLAARSNLDWKKISQAVAAIFLFVIIGFSTKIFLDYLETSDELDAAKISVDELREDIILKENVDADIAELHRLNKICAAQDVTLTEFNFLLNLGKIAGGDVRLTKIRAEENFLELEGLAKSHAAMKNYLSRVKIFVVQNARLENSSERDDGEILFVIRAETHH